MQSRSRLLTALLATAMLAGCQTIGPGSIQRDRTDYAGAIADSWKEQTLLNIVKLRYLDTPTFLDVSSVISSYQLQGEVRFSREIFPNAVADSNRSFGLTGIYTDRPTISYAPLTGEKYVNSLLRPIPPQAIFGMIISGHQADFILRATVRGINDVYSHSAAPARARLEDPDFSRVIAAIRRLQRAGALGMRIETEQGGRGALRIEIQQSGVAGTRSDRPGRAETTWLFFGEKRGGEVDRDIRLLRESLGLSPDAREVRLTFGSLRRAGDEIAMLTRSIMEIMVELSTGVAVPEQHVAEGRARPVREGSDDAAPGGYPIARIHASVERPQDAYIAVQYRNYWFWIDDRDLAAKRVFTFLRMFSSIAETGTTPQLPVLTIPAN